MVAQPRVDGAPALSAVRALKDAVAATSGCRVDRARVDRHGSLGVDGQGEDKSPRGEDQHRPPVTPAVGALEDAAACAHVEGGRGLGIDGQGAGKGVGQARVDAAPALPAVSALEDAPVGAREEGGGSLRIDGQGEAASSRVQPRVDGAPGRPAVGALEDTITGGARVEGGGGLGVDRERIDSLAVWPVGRPHVDSRLSPVEADQGEEH